MPAKVSIIVPCYNEVESIGGLLEAIREQNYDVMDLQVVVADGGSTDGTRAVIEAFAREHSQLKIEVVDNPDRSIPAALNRAIAAAQGEFVIRLDAHSAPRPDYVERCLRVLQRPEVANVGGRWDIQPSRDTWIARAIASAAAHPMGAGDARYRTGGSEGQADTVPFGAFRREWLAKIGPFNETLLTNEDYEYNHRIRQAGGVIWFDPSIQSVYIARGRFRDLASQYARYGYWKGRMLRAYPDSVRWRQGLPMLFVLATLILALASPFNALSRTLLAGGWSLYGLVLLSTGALSAVRRRDASRLLSLPLALVTMHLAWGLGALRGLIAGPPS